MKQFIKKSELKKMIREVIKEETSNKKLNESKDGTILMTFSGQNPSGNFRMLKVYQKQDKIEYEVINDRRISFSVTDCWPRNVISKNPLPDLVSDFKNGSKELYKVLEKYWKNSFFNDNIKSRILSDFTSNSAEEVDKLLIRLVGYDASENRRTLDVYQRGLGIEYEASNWKGVGFKISDMWDSNYLKKNPLPSSIGEYRGSNGTKKLEKDIVNLWRNSFFSDGAVSKIISDIEFE